jgi:hypothetical protein
MRITSVTLYITDTSVSDSIVLENLCCKHRLIKISFNHQLILRIMPPKRRGTKRKARTTVEGECESRLLQPDPGNRSRRSLRSNVIDFEEIIRGSGVLPASDDSANSSNAVSQQNINEGCGGVFQQTTSQMSETDRAQVVANPPRAQRHALAQYNLNPH